ncbi:hypothetical protein KTC96_24075 (plasmid) [Clostridium estertheticum]|uniref:hypothetical protein n=1 Tax=Clostridium estertheticum TaxID=238834 RepID=UPI001C7DA07E|nr:hypothetical protein [Clostridium estertheticum]MBX4262917.1 hypothetical protein [Clostridium estertheticum]WLC73203.1 hypothetical protein KTC96_24075 [Clostridium estertheticum]
MKNKKVINILLGLLIIIFSFFLIYFAIKMGSSDEEATGVGMYFLGFPIFTIILSIIMQLLIKRKIIVLAIIYIGYLILELSFTSLSDWSLFCLVIALGYVFFALIGTFIADFILKHRKKSC